ncbi:hypothetical protein [Legionella fallonii]|uniref:Uncharacterized protein n=1 Tax=Legionella fallonii LLAP-10 TaxID=1212491 RepID=A0A098G633_9GAMM|nr:hypothetical protein [Legionella fallonii]CEG56965.1 protein of unknown function [Legionella fallonii LLAP-10]
MKTLFNKFAVDFFEKASNGQCLSALVFFDDEISNHIDHRLFDNYVDSWFTILIHEYERLPEQVKKLIDFEIDDIDIFACPSSENHLN